MRIIFYALLYLILSSCSQAEPQENYPDTIKKYHLERQFDMAKWELYKINSIPTSEYSTDFVVSFQNQSEIDSFLIKKHTYKNQGKNLLLDKAQLVKLFGEKKITYYTNCELDMFLNNIDSLAIFRDSEIQLTFFPTFGGHEKSTIHKLGSGFYYTVVFEGNTIKRIGSNDYMEWDYEVKDYPDSMFYEIIEKRKEEISPWLLNEYKRRLKSEK
jgi:hypothetical protein